MSVLRTHRPLALTTAAMAVLALVSLVGLGLDDRTLTGVPIWLKPFKFAVSLAIYTLTLAWLVSLVRRGARAAWWLGTVIAVGALVEMVVIAGQVIRGRQSHFNVATSLDATLYSVMGTTIVIVWVATAAVGVLLLRQRAGDRATTGAIRLALPIALAGMAVGFLMTRPTPAQQAGFESGPPAIVGAHSVATPDGGPGLPLVNWSTVGGDLRVGHFIGLHALQALPLLAFGLALVARRVRRLRPDAVRARLVAVAAAGYAGLTVLTTWQALRGQSVVAPDALTLATAGTLLAGLIAAAGWALTANPAGAPLPDPAGTLPCEAVVVT
jgi:hypothetical protein